MTEMQMPGAIAEVAPTLEARTLRDYFAAHAPPMTKEFCRQFERKHSEQSFRFAEAEAAWAYSYADAMMEARK